MDRLVCGDVGFGKTEVAMRAAFTVVNSGKQVVILVPTTLLAHQHLQNFRDRFANWPVNVEELSRFRTGKEQTKVIGDTESGKVDILISTHKLIHAEINFKVLLHAYIIFYFYIMHSIKIFLFDLNQINI